MEGGAMKRIPKAIYMTSSELDERIRQREADAAMQSDGETRQTILKEIAQLRWYADTKRWIESPGLKAAR
jgi:hypothetical protein